MERSLKRSIMFRLCALKCLRPAASRLKKTARYLKMKHYRITIGVLSIGSCFITLLLYYWHRNTGIDHKNRLPLEPSLHRSFSDEYIGLGTPMVHVNLDDIYKASSSNDSNESFLFGDTRRVPLLDTSGCQIPVSMIDYEKFTRKRNKGTTCGKRAVFLKKDSEDKLRVIIKTNFMKSYLRRSARFVCCYRFIYRDPHSLGKKHIRFTTCKNMQDRDTITLETDFVNVKCSEYDRRNMTRIIYDDVYAFVKKINTLKKGNPCPRSRFNVLMIGMDSMSLPRFSKTMIRSVRFFQDNFWLGFRGYHKIGDNTFPNLMGVLSGQNLSTLAKTCSNLMDECNEDLIWSKFKEEGYVTAYGEDYLRLPDTFNGKYEFLNPPTDHYLRPFYSKGEKEYNNKSLVCSGKMPSGHHLLDYALDFAMTYRNESFFGVFWMNSYSHNENTHPEDADKMLENFLNRLTYTGVLDKTFVIFFSDHGIRFGVHRLKVESYYDERLPSLFLWSPNFFKSMFSNKYKALAVNQFRLITPYDLFNTLMEIRRLSTCRNDFTRSVSDACPNCQSLFSTVNSNRTCEDVAIENKWCSCHKLFPLDQADMSGVQSVTTVVSRIQAKIKTIKTTRCTACMYLSLKNIVRIHFYYDRQKTKLYHVVAFTMIPGNVSYEATVLRDGDNTEVIGKISMISTYRGLGKCAMQSNDRLFCVCQKIDRCRY